MSKKRKPSSVRPGVYRHSKTGNIYIVDRVLRDATNGREGRLSVIYMSVALNEWFSRDLEEFDETIEVDGKRMPRYIRIGSQKEVAKAAASQE